MHERFAATRLPDEPVHSRSSRHQKVNGSRLFLHYAPRNPSLAVASACCCCLALFSVLGALVYDLEQGAAALGDPGMPPSGEYPVRHGQPGPRPVGGDGRRHAADAPDRPDRRLPRRGHRDDPRLRRRVLRRLVDAVIRGIVDVGLTIPGLLVLIIIAIAVKVRPGVDQMALIVASLAWLYPTRTIRAQVLTHPRARLRPGGPAVGHERAGDHLQGADAEPAALPRGVAGRLGHLGAVLASIGLEALGLGPMDAPTLGMTLYWVIYNAALLLGLWWWLVPPIAIIVILFVGLFYLAVGLDEIANPRLRRSV